VRSFSELLSEYVNRIGVADAELARRLGVSRQTVFRWREGQTQRPRHREDVIALATKLRLEANERDQLLMSAGFRPEVVAPVGDVGKTDVGPIPATQYPKQPFRDIPAGPAWPAEATFLRPVLRRRWLFAALAGLIVLVIGLTSTDVWQSLASRLGLMIPGSTPMEPVAATFDETLILVSPFANYGSGQIGFNVASRLQEALREVFGGSGLEQVRIEVLPETIMNEAGARRSGMQLAADLVIWGEYDSGRVIAHVTAPGEGAPTVSQERRWILETSEALSTTINTDLPQDIQWMALYTLGQVHYRAGRVEKAEAVFERALGNLPEDPTARGAVFNYLGSLETQKTTPDLDKVIAYYTQAIELLPRLPSALNNRGVAYLERAEEGDHARAEDDFRKAIGWGPDFSAAHLNLAISLLRDNPDDFDEPLALLEQAEELEPDSPGIQNALCWDLSLAGKPDQALPHCDEAVRLDPSGLSNDSRGVALAMLGRHLEAIDEFRIFLDRIRTGNPSAYARYSATRQAWIVSLENGLDPFDAATRRSLLQD